MPGAFIKSIRSRIDARLSSYLAEKREFAARMGDSRATLVDAITELTMRGGKRLRPAVVYAAHSAVTGRDDIDAVIDVGASLELLQTYLLIHDDWMDEDSERRGGPTVHVALAREVGDGVILTCVGADDLPVVLPHCAPHHEVVAWITVCPSTDAARVRAIARRRLAGYLAAPAYEAQQRWLGRGDALEPVWAAWRDGRGLDAAAAAIPDSVVDALVVHGAPEACREHLARFTDAGVTTPILEVLPGVLEFHDAWRLLAPDTADRKR